MVDPKLVVMTRVRIGVQIHPQHGDVAGMRRAAVLAEELGADLLYVWDHFYPLYGAPDGSHFECWTLLSAWAEATSTIELGPLVTCNSYRNPNLLADMARTVDHVSGGRLVFGIGSGWFARDYEEYGYSFGTPGSRIEALREALPVIRARWRVLNPPPTRRIPLLIGGTGPRRTLPLVAEYADIWHAMFPASPAELEPAIDVLRARCAAAGRDPAQIDWAVGIEPDALAHDLSRHADDYVKQGFRQFTLGINGPDYDLTTIRDWLVWRDRQG
ncbi:MAG TPA: LLM class F420-dependent oxidoreductase [Micromonosporaceae bacterium]